MVCDHIGAGKVYKKDEWTPNMPIEHLTGALKRNVWMLHPATKELLIRLETDFAKMGFEALKEPYVDKICKEIDYDNAPSCNYYGENVTDLELDFKGENRQRDAAPILPKQSIGILGGTLDPIHKGHLAIAERVKAELGLDKIIFIPAGISAWKSEATPASHRVKMAQLATEDNPDFEVSTIEAQRSGTSRTIDTMRELPNLYPNAKIHFILGADTFKDIMKFQDSKELAKTVNFVILPREGVSDSEIYRQISDMQDQYGTKAIYLPGAPIDISSTKVREGDLSLLPEKVVDYVRKAGLYGTAVPSTGEAKAIAPAVVGLRMK
jgi:nicotinate-nucleotide adenylyltransferase